MGGNLLVTLLKEKIFNFRQLPVTCFLQRCVDFLDVVKRLNTAVDILITKSEQLLKYLKL